MDTGRFLFLIILIFTVLIAVPCAAQTAVPALAPLNPAFVNYFKNTSIMMQDAESEEHPSGIIPEPFTLPSGPIKYKIQSATSLPASYDLRSYGKLTPTKNQGQCGCCWSFAAYGSLESTSLPSKTWDFSENNLKNTHGFDFDCCDGGNRSMATAYLARWSGAILEANDPFNSGNCSSPSGLSPVKHIQDVIYIPDRANSVDNNAIKQAVMDYGAVYTSYYESSSYYNWNTKGYYYNGDTDGNHAVCVVGWDDNFSRANFNTAAPGDGAFLIRNSWGSNRDYFYISYYDTNIGSENAVFLGEDSTNYSKVYQYDNLGMTSNTGYGTTTAWFANAFLASDTSQLAAVSWYSAAGGGAYELYIYTGVMGASSPINGTLAKKITGTIATAGYHTIKLDSPVQLTMGQKFSVVVKLTTPGFNYPIPLEQPVQNYSSGATANSGQSYMSFNGTSWTDVIRSYANTNVCLKAFIAQTALLSVSPDSALTVTGAAGGPFQQNTQSYTLTNNGIGSMSWGVTKTQAWSTISTTNGTLAPGASTPVSISVNSNANTLAAGPYSDTITFYNITNGTGNTTRNVSLTVAGNICSIQQAKGLIDNSPVTLKNKTITAVFSNCVYAEEADKSSGIRILTSDAGLQIGDTITVIGTIRSYKPDNINAAEREIQDTTIIK